MGFQSKTYSLSDEVVEAIERLRRQYGSPNKAFTAILLQNSEISEKKDIHDGFPGHEDVKDPQFEPDESS